MTVHVIGIRGTSPVQSKKVEVTFGPADITASNKCTILVKSHKNLVVGREQYNFRPLKRK